MQKSTKGFLYFFQIMRKVSQTKKKSIIENDSKEEREKKTHSVEGIE